MWIHNYETDILFMKCHTSANVSKSLLATKSENVNLSLPLSRLIMPFKELLCHLK